MANNKVGSNKYNRFLFRIAGAISAIATLIAFLIHLLMFDVSIARVVLFAALVLAITFVGAYLLLRRLLKKRLEKIDRITKNIAQSEFGDYKNLRRKNRNELDALVLQCRVASRAMEQEINRLNKIEDYRKEFIGDISHELKTPIFAIQGFVETLLDGAIDDKKVNRQFLEKALRNVNRLNYLTKDLMEISKLETGELTSNKEKIKLYNVVSDVIESLQYKAEEEGVLIQIDGIDKEVMVEADRRQLRRVFINLVENGIKYNKIGGLVTVSAKPYTEGTNKILVEVADTGLGMKSEYLERVTERFFRIDKSRSRKKGGTGLGLAIVKHIIEAHDQQLFIESTPGEGSVFSFTLQMV